MKPIYTLLALSLTLSFQIKSMENETPVFMSLDDLKAALKSGAAQATPETIEGFNKVDPKQPIGLTLIKETPEAMVMRADQEAYSIGTIIFSEEGEKKQRAILEAITSPEAMRAEIEDGIATFKNMIRYNKSNEAAQLPDQNDPNMHIFISFYCDPLLNMLIKTGADLHARNVKGQTALEYALEMRTHDPLSEGCQKIIRLLEHAAQEDVITKEVRGKEVRSKRKKKSMWILNSC